MPARSPSSPTEILKLSRELERAGLTTLARLVDVMVRVRRELRDHPPESAGPGTRRIAALEAAHTGSPGFENLLVALGCSLGPELASAGTTAPEPFVATFLEEARKALPRREPVLPLREIGALPGPDGCVMVWFTMKSDA